MCLAVPGRIVETHDDRGTPMGTIDFDGIRKEICLVYLPDIEVGAYALVHAGFAIARVDEVAALEALAIFDELGTQTGDVANQQPGVSSGEVAP